MGLQGPHHGRPWVFGLHIHPQGQSPWCNSMHQFISVWDDSVIPHTLCNVLKKPKGSTQEKPCILLHLNLTCQMQEQPQVCLAHTNPSLTHSASFSTPSSSRQRAAFHLHGWSTLLGWVSCWFELPRMGEGTKPRPFLAEELLQLLD